MRHGRLCIETWGCDASAKPSDVETVAQKIGIWRQGNCECRAVMWRRFWLEGCTLIAIGDWAYHARCNWSSGHLLRCWEIEHRHNHGSRLRVCFTAIGKRLETSAALLLLSERHWNHGENCKEQDNTNPSSAAESMLLRGSTPEVNSNEVTEVLSLLHRCLHPLPLPSSPPQGSKLGVMDAPIEEPKRARCQDSHAEAKVTIASVA